MEAKQGYSKTLTLYLSGIGALIGTVVGVGVFGLPFVAAKAGIVTALFYLLVFGIIMSFVHLLYFQVVLHTKERHRFTGYVGYYFGKKLKAFTFVQSIISYWGTLLLYTVIGGRFLAILLSQHVPHIVQSSEVTLGLIFFLLAAFVVSRGSYAVGKQEFYLSAPLLIIIVLIFIIALSSPSFETQNIPLVNISQGIMPYGVTLFALAGFSVIPTIKILLDPGLKRKNKLSTPLIMFLGTLIPALFYMLFVLGVVGISGSATSQDALSGLEPFLGKGIVGVGALLGIFALYTSFIAIGDELKNTFSNDYKAKEAIAIILTFSVPLLLYLLNIRDFIAIANILGAFMGGYMGIMVVALFIKMAKGKGAGMHLPRWIAWSIMVIFSLASLYALRNALASFL